MKPQLWTRLNTTIEQVRIQTVVTESSVEHVIDCDICKGKVPTREIEVLTYQEGQTLLCRTCAHRLLTHLAHIALGK